MARRFTEEEAQRVFARAAERQHAHAAPPDGLTLAELQEIGRAAGLDPERVAAAVVESAAFGPTAPPASFFGVSVEPRASRVVPGEVTDEAWEQMVNRLRRTFRSKGTPVELGRVREWSSGLKSNLHVSLEPVEDGTLIALETSRAEEAKSLRSVPATVGAFVVLLSLLFGFGDFDLYVWIIPALLVLGAAASMIIGRQVLSAWSEKHQGQFDALLDQFELIVRDAEAEASPPESHPAHAKDAGAGRLDIDALPDAAEGGAAPRRRDRA